METSAKISQELNNISEQNIEQTAVRANITLTPFLNGLVYFASPATKTGYSAEEIVQIKNDLQMIEQEAFKNKSSQEKPQYIATAGTPGTGKTFFIEQMFNPYSLNYVYIDPDRFVLPKLTGYQVDLKKGVCPENAYIKWRDASNYIANHMFVRAICSKLNIIHGTTSGSPRMVTIYKELSNCEYNIKLHILFADCKLRQAAINARNKIFVQVIAADAASKGQVVIDRLDDCYFDYADEISLYLQQGDYWLGKGELGQIVQFTKKDMSAVLTKNEKLLDMFFQQLREDAASAEKGNAVIKKLLNYAKNQRADEPSFSEDEQPYTYGEGRAILIFSAKLKEQIACNLGDKDPITVHQKNKFLNKM